MSRRTKKQKQKQKQKQRQQAAIKKKAASSHEPFKSDAMEKAMRFAIREGGRTVGAGRVGEIIK